MKFNRFWKIYLIVVACTVFFLACGFSVFYRFIESYEHSQPEYAAQVYADRLTDAQVSAALLKAVPEDLSPFESADAVHSAFVDAFKLLSGGVNVKKNYKKYTSSAPVFYITKGDAKIAEITLASDNSGAFGMTRWSVSSLCAVLENWAPERKNYTVYVPCGSLINIGETAILAEPTKRVPYEFLSKYEPSVHAEWDVYNFEGLYLPPAVECELDGEACSFAAEGTALKFSYPDALLDEYTITVPSGSLVHVNGIQLTNDDVPNEVVLYDYVNIEAKLDGLPTATVYKLPALFAEPTVSVTLHGVLLDCTNDGAGYVAPYPQDLLYDCTIYVPSGSTVYLRGQEYPAAEAVNKPAFPAFERYLPSMPEYDVYTISDLFISPENAITVLKDGAEIPLSVSKEGTSIIFRAGYHAVENPSVSERALNFARDYITYTAQGYNNLDWNLSKVLSYVYYGTDTYQRISTSRYGIYYVTPVTRNEYKKLEVTSMTQYADDIYQCTVEFAVDQDTYYIHNEYAGTFTLLFAFKNDVWYLFDMYIDTK